VDCGIHDIDMARWLFGLTTAVTISDSDDTPRVKRVFSTGLSVRHPELAETNDADNAICVVEFTGGKVLDFHLSRTGLHGHDCFTEVFGSERKVIINGVSVGPGNTSVSSRQDQGSANSNYVPCTESHAQQGRDP
jgi:myo-inositol 2-dehydrogenase/D-chiro-inositol 1-dehydrogenase